MICFQFLTTCSHYMKEFPFECGSSEERSQVECIHWLPKCTPEDRARIRNGISVRIDQTRLLRTIGHWPCFVVRVPAYRRLGAAVAASRMESRATVAGREGTIMLGK